MNGGASLQVHSLALDGRKLAAATALGVWLWLVPANWCVQASWGGAVAILPQASWASRGLGGAAGCCELQVTSYR